MQFESDYVEQLAVAVESALPGWLRRSVVGTAARMTGTCSAELVAAADIMALRAAPEVLDELIQLLATDVDAQRTNPLSILRGAVRHPTAVLAQHDVPTPPRDEFAVRAFPHDVYNLSPATWADVDETLRDPGLIWGAWKAKTVLDRRRAEGRRVGESGSG